MKCIDAKEVLLVIEDLANGKAVSSDRILRAYGAVARDYDMNRERSDRRSSYFCNPWGYMEKGPLGTRSTVRPISIDSEYVALVPVTTADQAKPAE